MKGADWAQKLNRSGIVVIPILSQAQVDKSREGINKDILNGPEVVEGLKCGISQLQGGSFGAIGSPSSFHGKHVRLTRWHVYKQLVKTGFCQEFAALSGQLNLEVSSSRFSSTLGIHIPQDVGGPLPLSISRDQGWW